MTLIVHWAGLIDRHYIDRVLAYLVDSLSMQLGVVRLFGIPLGTISPSSNQSLSKRIRSWLEQDFGSHKLRVPIFEVEKRLMVEDDYAKMMQRRFSSLVP